MPKVFPDKDAIVDEICGRMEKGEAVIDICQDEHLPHVDTFRVWREDNEDYSAMYVRARDIRTDHYANKIIHVAETCGNEVRNDEGDVTEGKSVEQGKVMIDAYKWTAAKLNPKKYGDKLTTDNTTKHEFTASLSDLREAMCGKDDEG